MSQLTRAGISKGMASIPGDDSVPTPGSNRMI